MESIHAQVLFERLFESSPDAVIVTGSDGRMAQISAQVETFFGYSRSELVGQPVEILIPERFRPAHPSHRAEYDPRPCTRAMGAGLQLFGRRKDGSEFPVDIMLSPVEADGERLTLAVIRDVTDRKQAEELLRQSEERFRLLVEDVKDYAIFMLDPSGRVVSWNAGAERAKGYRANEILGQHFSRFYSQADIDTGKPERELEMAASQGRIEDEGWRIRKDGSRFWANVAITALRNSHGELLGFSKVTRDFTERKKAEEALQFSERRFRSLFEFSPDAILVADLKGSITEVNGRAQEFFGYGRAELIGQLVEILIPERFRSAHPKHRADYADHPRIRAMGVGLELRGRRRRFGEIGQIENILQLDPGSFFQHCHLSPPGPFQSLSTVVALASLGA